MRAELENAKEMAKFIKTIDFFNYITDSPDAKIESIKAWGTLSEKKPLVSVCVTTYKRPALLRMTLLSILNQKSFDDFEIIVTDNSGDSVDNVTETQKVIEELNSKKIIFYKNCQGLYDNYDRAVSYARSEWICFVHDDDCLHPFHLYIMTEIIKNNPGIDFLSCDLDSVNESRFKDYFDSLDNEKILGPGICTKVSVEETILGYNNAWQGALIRKDRWNDIGGMMKIKLINGIPLDMDLETVSRFTYRFSRHRVRLPLYIYRSGNPKDTDDHYTHLCMVLCVCYYYKYAMRTIKGDGFVYRRIVEGEIIKKMESSMKNNTWDTDMGRYFLEEFGIKYPIPKMRKFIDRFTSLVWKAHIWSLRNEMPKIKFVIEGDDKRINCKFT